MSESSPPGTPEGRTIKENVQCERGTQENYLDYEKQVGDHNCGVSSWLEVENRDRCYGYERKIGEVG